MTRLPLIETPAGETTATLLAALGVGIAFGWALERGGLGNARKLAAQFYLRDFTVVKVMFSAIVTAMLGLFWLSRAGMLDASRLHVPPTIPAAQLAGGALFGLGFLVAGLCPGTSCVSAASGRVDGLAALVGLLAGTALYDAARPRLGTLPDAGARDAMRLPELLGASEGIVVAGVVLMALAMFAIAERVEGARADAAALGATRPASRRPLAYAAGLLAFGAATSRMPDTAVEMAATAPLAGRGDVEISALELARWIRDGRAGLRVVDLRDENAWRDLAVPGALHDSLAGLLRSAPRPDETLVVYSEPDSLARLATTLLRARGREHVRVLRGGTHGWITQIVNATLPADADSSRLASWPEVAALSRYFGGQPRVERPTDAAGSRPTGAARPRPRPATPAATREGVDELRRRGCEP
jgi:uncharacterized membrane protein YedE/YeeE/rhodanese-related sulfurtransferase